MDSTFFIRITGQVQGVGFRPFVYQQAEKYQLKGWVNNSLEGVQIQVSGDRPVVEQFIRALKEENPPVSQIAQFSVESIPFQAYSSFEIVKSNREGTGQLVLTPDLAMCPSCLAELHDPANRRYRYPFITCNYCGPRYSIIQGLPYDRELISMAPFTMCSTCQEEYDTPSEWRFFSQTNSCANCGISVALYQTDNQLLETDYAAAISRVVQAIQVGQIVAVKGIGGYLLLCDAGNEEAVKLLRVRKGRARKPFALMYPDLETLESDVVLDPIRREALSGLTAPIVLARIQPGHSLSICTDLVAPGLDQLGVMIPYAPLFELLLAKLGKPIVATSANRTSSPIVYSDEKALHELSKMADLILVHDREIIMPQDDSVLRLSAHYDQPIVLRRSRGLAPAFMHPHFDGLSETVLAMGADMKSTFGFLHRTFAYISQYLGDLDSFDTQERFRQCRDRFVGWFGATPAVVLVDQHPLYFSTQLGRELAEEKKLPLLEVQHHIAHFAAVLGENHLVDSPDPILGVIWDGTGMGTDGQIWGGEFFKYEKAHFARVGQLDYFDLILGDKMPREPRIAALSASQGVSGAEELLQPKFSASEWLIYQKLLQKPKNLQTSSMGRLFDAVASLLNILDVAEYEGEAPLYVEQKASAWFDREGLDFSEHYSAVNLDQGRIHTKAILGDLIADVKQGISVEKIAARFHNTLVYIVEKYSKEMAISKLAFSGGVFQNEVLVDLLIHRMGTTHKLYFHQQLSPNDECISFGQLAWYYIQHSKQAFIPEN